MALRSALGANAAVLGVHLVACATDNCYETLRALLNEIYVSLLLLNYLECLIIGLIDFDFTFNV